MAVPLGGVEWEEHDIRSPWSGRPGRTWCYSRDASSLDLAIMVTARDFDTVAAAKAGTVTLDQASAEIRVDPCVKCVVLGRRKFDTQGLQEEVEHFVLLVQPDVSSRLHGRQAYHRIGVARMQGALIEKGGAGIPGLLR